MRRVLNDDTFIMRPETYSSINSPRSYNKNVCQASTKLLARIGAFYLEYGRKTVDFRTVTYGNIIMCVSE